MRRSRFTEEQIVPILAEGRQGGGVRALCRRHGMPDRASARRPITAGRPKYGGMQISDAQRLKALEEENRRLKRLVADQALNVQVLKDLLGKEW